MYEIGQIFMDKRVPGKLWQIVSCGDKMVSFVVIYDPISRETMGCRSSTSPMIVSNYRSVDKAEWRRLSVSPSTYEPVNIHLNELGRTYGGQNP